VTWSGEVLELGGGTAEGRDEGLLAPELMDLAERIISGGAASAHEATAWARCFDEAHIEYVLPVYADNAAVAASNAGDRCNCTIMLNVALGRLLPLGVKQSPARGMSNHLV